MSDEELSVWDGFPYAQIIVIAICRFAEPVAFTSIFPYIYFMVKSFLNKDTPDTEISRYAGYVSASFAAAQILTGLIWGQVSDRIGRKPVMLIGLLGTMVSSLAFGFSTSLPQAIISRLVSGLLNGNASIVRTLLAENATEKRHQPLAFSVMPLMWQIGSVIGPIVGGVLSQPDINLPNTFFGRSPFFKKYPFALPNLVISIALAFSSLLVLLFLDETLETKKFKRDPPRKFGKLLINYFNHFLLRKPFVPPKNEVISDESNSQASSQTNQLIIPQPTDNQLESTPLLIESSSQGSSGNYNTNIINTTTKGYYHHHKKLPDRIEDELQNVNLETEASTLKTMPWKDIFNSQVCLQIISYMILSFHTTGYDFLLPVFLSTSRTTLKLHFPYSHGGLDLSSSDVGLYLSITGIVGIFLMLFWFPNVDRRLGSLRSYRISLKLFPVVYYIIPLLIFIPYDTESLKSVVIPACIMSTMIFRVFVSTVSFPENTILLTRAATVPQFLGTINGLAQVCSSLSRAIVPVFIGLIMSYGQAHHIASLGWWCLGIVAISGALQSPYLRDGYN